MKIDDREDPQELEKMSDEDLKAVLSETLKKVPPEGDRVREILRILRQRDAGPREIPEGARQAWEDFCGQIEQEEAAKRSRRLSWLGRIAATAAVLCLIVFAVPYAFGAKNIVQLVAIWTNDTLQLVRPGETTTATRPYVFHTDHPGLQEVYDTVTGLGLSGPMVPTWVPDGYELTELKVTELHEETKVFSTFYNGDKKIVFSVHIDKVENAPIREKNPGDAETMEINRIPHYIVENVEEWTAAWERENARCCLSTSEDKSVLIEILESIY